MAEIKRLRIHLMVEDAEAGPVVSKPAEKGSLPIGGRDGKITRWRFACQPSPSTAILTALDRGTSEPWCVQCDACKATKEFAAIDAPHPSTPRHPEQMVANGSACC